MAAEPPPPLKGRSRSRSGTSRLASTENNAVLVPQPLAARSSTMPTDSEPGAHRHGLPPWDRIFDAVCHRYTADERNIDKSANFGAALDSFFSKNGRVRGSSGYFRLPNNIRLLICQHLLAAQLQHKPIRLNSRSFDRDVWRSEDFQYFSAAFAPLAPYLAVSFGFRADMLIAFLSQSIFHVTFSPYVKPNTSPLATMWLNRYSPFMQNIVVEVDLTRLGHGPAPETVNLLRLDDSVEKLLQDFVQAQLERGESLPLDSLVLLCRRFRGRRSGACIVKPSISAEQSSQASAHSRRSQRSDILSRVPSGGPQDHDSDRTVFPTHSLRQVASPTGTPSSTPTPTSAADESPFMSKRPELQLAEWPMSPLSLAYQLEYCPDSILAICNHFVHLRGSINSLRMCGFSESYTNRFIAALFPDVLQNAEKCSYRVAPSTIWPRLPGQKSFVDIGEGCLILDDHSVNPVQDVRNPAARWEGCYQLPPPILDMNGGASLPCVVDMLQLIRSRVIEPSLQSQVQQADIMAQVIIDKKRVMGLLDRYYRAKGSRKRTLTREISATL